MTQQPPTMSPSTLAEPPRKPLWRRWWAITAYVVVALGVIGSLSGDPEKDQAALVASATSAPASTSTTTSDTTTTGASTTGASTTTSPASPRTTTAPKPPAPPKPRRADYKGKGARVLTIAKPTGGAVMVTLTHSGRANFVVWTLGADLKEADLLVNTIGRYQGTVLMDAQGEDTKRVKIEADGAWKLSVVELSAAPRFGMGRPAQGTGDAVLIYTGAAGVITSDHRGQANFVVTAYSDDAFPDLIVNEIGRYHGEGTIGDGPQVISIQADGRWALRVS